MTRKQKFWFAGGGALAAAGGAAALMVKHKVTPAQAVYKGAKKVVTAVNLAGPTARGVAQDLGRGYRRNRAVREVDRRLWKATGLRVVPKEPKPTKGLQPLESIKGSGKGPVKTVVDAVKGAAEKLASKTPGAKRERFKAAFVKRMQAKQLPKAPKGALNLRISGHVAEVVGGTGEAKIPRFLDEPNQGKLAGILRAPKGKKKISETNINRLLDQRRAMKIPDRVAPLNITHQGGFTSNPAGMSAYEARPRKTKQQGVKMDEGKALSIQDRTLRNQGPRAAAHKAAKALQRREKKLQGATAPVEQGRVLGAQRRAILKWWKSGYKTAKKQ